MNIVAIGGCFAFGVLFLGCIALIVCSIHALVEMAVDWEYMNKFCDDFHKNYGSRIEALEKKAKRKRK